MIKKSLLKIVCLLIIIGLNWTGLLAVGQTFAFFTNAEGSNDNTFTAATLDFSLRSGQTNFTPLKTALNMKPGDTVARDIYIKKEGSLPFQYTAVSEPVDGLCDLNLYNALQLKIWYNWYEAEPGPPPDHLQYRHMDLKYSGLLKDFDLRALNPDDPDLQIPNAHPYFDNLFYGPDEHWFYSSQIILPSAVPADLQNKSCQFKFVFDGWQTNLPDSSTGFSDEERIGNVIESGKWIIDPGDVVINELMWMGSRGGLSWGGEWPEDEWIELRNTTHYPIDLGGWQIIKKTSSGEELMLEIPSGTIPAHGFFLISNFDKGNSRIAVDPDLMDSSVDLRNRNLQIKLYKGNWPDPNNLIDTADDGKRRPLAGFRFLGFLHFSMERNDIPGDGTLKVNWHTCWDDSSEMKAYWDPLMIFGASINRGTPGGRNLSEEDEAELIEYYQQLEAKWLAEGLFIPDPILEEENYDEEEVPEIPIEEEPLAEEEILLEEEPVIDEEPVNEGGPTDEEIPADEETPVSEEEIITEGTEEEIAIEGTTEEISEDSVEEITEEVVDEVVEEEPIVEEIPVTEEEPPVEEVTTEENQEEGGGIIEEINEIIDEVIEEIVDEIMPDEETGDELVSGPEVPVIEDVPIIEEAPTEEAPVIEEQPAVEEQPVVVPDDSSPTQGSTGESGSDSAGDTAGDIGDAISE